MLREITAEDVRAAMAEFDAVGRDDFLRKYGFAPARGYILVHEGKRYDSKAICGAARGYARPGLGPLRADEFSGPQQSVERKLRSLGFEVRGPDRGGRQWTPEERALALQLYLQRGMLNNRYSLVVQLSEELNRRAFHSDAGTRADFRNPAGVALKLVHGHAYGGSTTRNQVRRTGRRLAVLVGHSAA